MSADALPTLAMKVAADELSPGITMLEIRGLLFLARHVGATQHAMHLHLDVTGISASRIITSLEAQGLIHVTRGIRPLKISVTTLGRSIVRQIASMMEPPAIERLSA